MGVSLTSLGKRGDDGSACRVEEVYALLLASELSGIILLLLVAEGLAELMLVWAVGSKMFP